MGTYSLSTIKTDVRKCINEIAANNAEFAAGTDGANLDAITESKIIDALTYVYNNADWTLLDADVTDTTSGHPTPSISTQTKIATIVLPSTFLRLMYVKADSWKRYLSQDDIIFWTDKGYNMLSDVYCTGTPERPKVSLQIENVTEGETTFQHKTLKLYKVTADNESIVFGFKNKPVVNNSNVVINELVYDGFIYYLSALVAMTFTEERARDLFTIANNYLGVRTNGNDIQR